MGQLDSDTFPYAAGALETVSSGKWTRTSDSGFTGIDCDGAGSVTGHGNNDAVYIPTSWSGSTSDHYSEIKLGTLQNDGGPCVRVTDGTTTTMYLADLDPATAFPTTNYTIFMKNSATFTAVSGGSGSINTFTVGDVFRLEIQGTTLTLKQNGTVVKTCTDSTLATGKPGMHTDSTAIKYTDWAAGDFAGGAAINITLSEPTVTGGVIS